MTWLGNIVLMTTLFSVNAYGANLGVIGHVFPITEPDLLQEIQAKLAYLQQTGQLNTMMQNMQEQAKKQIVRPAPVSSITTTTVNQVRWFDPSIILSQDMKDAQGQVLWKKGTTVNPLVNVNLHETLLFFNGDDAKQVQWAMDKITNAHQPVKPILVQGNWSILMKKWHQTIYFDQGGHLTTRLGITHVPAMVTQEGLRLRIEEDVPPT